jgi:hypothetical protein
VFHSKMGKYKIDGNFGNEEESGNVDEKTLVYYRITRCS